MSEKFNYLFQYLDKEDITINKFEFNFQIQSHPDYPTLLSIADTLNFFNIDNGVLFVEKFEIQLLPNRFVALLDIENSQPQFYLVEKKDDVSFCIKDKEEIVISKQNLELIWKNTVLLVEKSKVDNLTQIKKSKWFWILPSLCGGFFLLILIQFQITLQLKLFFVFPILGVLFSVLSLKDLFGTNSEMLNSFCSLMSSSSCITVVNSSKWKIFKIVNFSDLSIIFFTSQFLGLLLFLFTKNTSAYFSIQKIILVCAIPILLASVYYQKFVEKKWCPICLVIIVVILLELGYILSLFKISIDFLIQPITITGFVLVSVASGWFALKQLLTNQKKLKEFQIKGNRFIRNYETFKNNLLTSDSIENSQMQLEETIVLGNPKASLKIIMVTNPFCSFCAEAHSVMEEILDKHSEKVFFEVHFNFDHKNSSQDSKKVHEELVSIYLSQGEQAFMKALHNWFENKDENKLSTSANSRIIELQSNLILEKQFIWNQLNNIKYTYYNYQWIFFT